MDAMSSIYNRVPQLALQLQTLQKVSEVYRSSDSKLRGVIKAGPGPLQDGRRLLDRAVKSFDKFGTDSWKWLCN